MKEYFLLYPKPGGSFQAITGLPINLMLKEARETKEIGIRELSRSVGCSHVYLMKIERGERTPAPKLLTNLQKALGLDPFILISKEEFMRDSLMVPIEQKPMEEPKHQQAYLLNSLLTCLRHGGFNPSLKSIDESEKKLGVVHKITLGTASNYEILIQET